MSLLNQANNIATTLSGNGGSITSGATSFLVASSTNFPSVPFTVIIGTEIVLVTAVSTLTWTVTRGSESSTAAAHNDGDVVRHVSTAAWANKLPQLQSGTATAQSGSISITQSDGTPTLTAANTISASVATADGGVFSSASGSGGATAVRATNSGSGSAGIFANNGAQTTITATNSGAGSGVFGTTANNGFFGVNGTNTAGTDGAGAGGKFDGGSHTIGLIVANNHATKATIDAVPTGAGPGLNTNRIKNNGFLYTIDTWANVPGSPSNGDHHYATDRNIEYYYNSTATRWYSTTLFAMNMTPIVVVTGTITATTTFGQYCKRPTSAYDILIDRCELLSFVATTFNATDHWTADLRKRDSSAASASLLSGTVDLFQGGRAANTLYEDNLTPAANSIYTNAQAYDFFVTYNKFASAGALSITSAVLWYRLVG